MIRYFANHPTAANLLMALLMAVGVAALPSLKRETFPDFSADAVQASVPYPGATAEEVEEAICQRIEDAVDGLSDLKEVRCEAREGIGTATIEMVKGSSMDRFLTNVKTEIDAIDSFPEIAEDPVVEQINLTDQVISIAITGPMAEPDLKVFAEDNGQDLLLSGEVDLTMEWNGDILQVMEEDDDISYVVPKEGSNVWQDCLCIPTGAPHPENAHKFINFILDAKAGAAIADFIYYATPNKAARGLLGDDYNKNPAIFPTDETLARCEPSLYLGEEAERIREESLTRIFAA